jgi:hypothetical protein
VETITIKKNEYDLLLECFNWNLVNDGNDKRLFPAENEENKTIINSIFRKFQAIEIEKEDSIYGIFNSGQKVLIAKAPNISEMVKELKPTGC